VTVTLQVLIELVGDDPRLLEELYDCGVLQRGQGTLEDTELEAALVARTLLRELEVNAAGVEIILRLREELLAQRRQVADFLALLRKR
jgi:hypothetical protein